MAHCVRSSSFSPDLSDSPPDEIVKYERHLGGTNEDGLNGALVKLDTPHLVENEGIFVDIDLTPEKGKGEDKPQERGPYALGSRIYDVPKAHKKQVTAKEEELPKEVVEGEFQDNKPSPALLGSEIYAAPKKPPRFSDTMKKQLQKKVNEGKSPAPRDRDICTILKRPEWYVKAMKKGLSPDVAEDETQENTPSPTSWGRDFYAIFRRPKPVFSTLENKMRQNLFKIFEEEKQREQQVSAEGGNTSTGEGAVPVDDGGSTTVPMDGGSTILPEGDQSEPKQEERQPSRATQHCRNAWPRYAAGAGLLAAVIIVYAVVYLSNNIYDV